MQNRPFDPTQPTSDNLPEDDIDLLFQKLEPLAVPESAIQQILARVKQLPPALRYQAEEAGSVEKACSVAGQNVSEALS
jgi:hypothetical protein